MGTAPTGTVSVLAETQLLFVLVISEMGTQEVVVVFGAIPWSRCLTGMVTIDVVKRGPENMKAGWPPRGAVSIKTVADIKIMADAA